MKGITFWKRSAVATAGIAMKGKRREQTIMGLAILAVLVSLSIKFQANARIADEFSGQFQFRRLVRLSEVPGLDEHKHYPVALEIPPAGSTFGNFLYISAHEFYENLPTTPEGQPPDGILRISLDDLSTPVVEEITELANEANPCWMAVPRPGSPFGDKLYINARNRDNYEGHERRQGGSIIFLNLDWNENFLSPPGGPPPVHLSDSRELTFGPGGAFGTNLFVVNNQKLDDILFPDIEPGILEISPEGQIIKTVKSLDIESNPRPWFSAIAFGPGGDFGSELFVVRWVEEYSSRFLTILKIDEDGETEEFVPRLEGQIDSIAFPPPGPFEGYMYVNYQETNNCQPGREKMYVYRIDPSGKNIKTFAEGMRGALIHPGILWRANPDGLAFSNDGNTLFIADRVSRWIHVITPHVDLVIPSPACQDTEILAGQQKTYQATNSITAAPDGTYFHIESGGDATFKAGNIIYLKPGFEARNGSKFRAIIGPIGGMAAPAASSLSRHADARTTEEVAQREADLSLPEKSELIPQRTRLLANYPNPFNPETWIPFHLAEAAVVTLTIYDMSGQVVRTIDVGNQHPGRYESRDKAIYWDGRNHLGERVANGVYFYQLTANNFSEMRKMLILK